MSSAIQGDYDIDDCKYASFPWLNHRRRVSGQVVSHWIFLPLVWHRDGVRHC